MKNVNNSTRLDDLPVGPGLPRGPNTAGPWTLQDVIHRHGADMCAPSQLLSDEKREAVVLFSRIKVNKWKL